MTHPVSIEPRVNRVEVIDATGRKFVGYFDHPGAFLDLLDDDRTLRVFLTGSLKQTDHYT